MPNPNHTPSAKNWRANFGYSSVSPWSCFCWQGSPVSVAEAEARKTLEHIERCEAQAEWEERLAERLNKAMPHAMARAAEAEPDYGMLPPDYDRPTSAATTPE